MVTYDKLLFSADHTNARLCDSAACSRPTFGYWHHTVVCLSVCDGVHCGQGWKMASRLFRFL